MRYYQYLPKLFITDLFHVNVLKQVVGKSVVFKVLSALPVKGNSFKIRKVDKWYLAYLQVSDKML